MKLKKGSKEAKAFMAKLRAARKGAGAGIKYKKTKLVKPTKLQTKKTTRRKLSGEQHTDNNSHNYRISISGLNGKRNHLLSDLKNRFGYLSTSLLTAAKAADKRRIKKELSEIRKEIYQLTKKLK